MHRRVTPRSLEDRGIVDKGFKQIIAWVLDFRRWARFVVFAGVAWGQLALIVAALADPTPHNWAMLAAIETCGVVTLLLFELRGVWLPRLALPGMGRPLLLRRAMLFGIFIAALVEVIFWGWQNVFGVNTLAADPNLLIDFLITLPWYAGMVVLFVNLQDRRRFPISIALLLGAVYKLGVDGIVGGQVVPAVFGQAGPDAGSWAALVSLAFWQFIPVYSSIVVLPSLLVYQAPEKEPERPPEDEEVNLLNRPAPPFLDAFKPLIWLLPYTVYLLVLIGVISMLAEAAA